VLRERAALSAGPLLSGTAVDRARTVQPPPPLSDTIVDRLCTT
jgi:hypothetical protein